MPPFKLLSSLVLGSLSLASRDGQGVWTQMESEGVEGLWCSLVTGRPHRLVRVFVLLRC